MEQMLMGRHTPYLPIEITAEILKRLPGKSIIRFRCVSKQWKNLIMSPSFIADHLHHQSPSLLFSKYGSEPLHLRLMDCEMHVREVQNPPLIGSLFNPRIIGCSNGLLCVATHEYDRSTSSFLLFTSLLLWNPAIGEVRQIPRTRTVSFPHQGSYTTGFGFSAIVNDYKIVRTYAMRDNLISGVEVYSLSTGSWKEIGLGSLEGVTLVPGDSVTANGAIFWYALKKRENNIHSIISFDIAKEAFSLIPLPPQLNISSSEFRMTVYDDNLAILSLTMFGSFRGLVYSLIDLWVLEEGTGSSTERSGWTKKYTRNRCPSTLDFPGTIWRNEIVLGSFRRPRFTRLEMKNDKEKDYLYLMNIITNEGRMSRIPGYRFGAVFNYVENLVSVSNIHFEGSSS